MRRLAPLAAALVAAALASTALGDTTNWAGQTGDGDPVNFQVKDPPAGHKTVRHFFFGQGMDFVCDEAGVQGFEGGVGSMRVRHKKFHAHRDLGQFEVTVSGKFTEPVLAQGTLRATGHFPGFHHCDTGVLSWSASDL